MSHPAKLHFKCTYKNQSYIFIGIDSRGGLLYHPIDIFSANYTKKEKIIYNDRKFISDTYEEIADSLSRTYPSAKVYCCGNELSYISNDKFLDEVYLAPPSSSRIFPTEPLYNFVFNRENLSSLFNVWLNIPNYPISSIFVNKLKKKGLDIDTMATNLFFQHRYWFYFKDILNIFPALFFSIKSYFNLYIIFNRAINLLSFGKKISDVFNLSSAIFFSKTKNMYMFAILSDGGSAFLNKIIKKFIPNYDTLEKFLSKRKLFDNSQKSHPFYLKKQILNSQEESAETSIASLSGFSELDLKLFKEHLKTIKDEKFQQLSERILKIEFNNLENELFNEDEADLLENMLKDTYPWFSLINRRSFESLNAECLTALESISLLKWEKSYYAKKIQSIIEKNTSQKEGSSNSESRPLIFLIDEDYLNGNKNNSIINQIASNLTGFQLVN